MPDKPAPAKYTRARELRQAMTAAERLLWEWLRANRFKGLHFRRQHVIVDFYCREARLVVEVDGSVHATQSQYDAERDAILAGHGFHVLRVANAEVQEDIAAVLRQIEAACGDVSSPPAPPRSRGGVTRMRVNSDSWPAYRYTRDTLVICHVASSPSPSSGRG